MLFPIILILFSLHSYISSFTSIPHPQAPCLAFVTALPLAVWSIVDRLHGLHGLPVLDVFLCLLGLSERT